MPNNHHTVSLCHFVPQVLCSESYYPPFILFYFCKQQKVGNFNLHLTLTCVFIFVILSHPFVERFYTRRSGSVWRSSSTSCNIGAVGCSLIKSKLSSHRSWVWWGAGSSRSHWRYPEYWEYHPWRYYHVVKIHFKFYLQRFKRKSNSSPPTSLPLPLPLPPPPSQMNLYLLPQKWSFCTEDGDKLDANNLIYHAGPNVLFEMSDLLIRNVTSQYCDLRGTDDFGQKMYWIYPERRWGI